MILANDFKRQWAETREEVLSAVDAVGRSGWYVLGDEVRQFEAQLADSWGLEHAIGVSSGLDALEIGLRLAGCRPGDKVLTTPVSAFATTLAIVRAGGVPAFIDCDHNGLLDLELCERYLRANRDVRYFVPVHLYGQALDAKRMAYLRDEFGLKIVEDCAQAVGAMSGDIPVGKVGLLAATSFYPTKNLGALGDGGAILTDDPELARAAQRYRDYGQASKYRHVEMGTNSRLDELHAAILRRVHLPRLREWTQRRREIAACYTEGIIGGEGRPLRVLQPADPGGSCWHLYPVFVEPGHKGDFITWMRGQGVQVGEHYPVPIFAQPAMASIPHEVADACPLAFELCAAEVSLPIQPFLSDEEISSVVMACNGWQV